jgi:hypothetical protein
MRWIVLIIFGIIVGACTTLEVRLETPNNPDEEAIATLANLMFEGTQYAQLLSAQRRTPEPSKPPPSSSMVSGKVCYPGSTTPVMKLFFRNISTNELAELDIEEYQERYDVELYAGSYYAYAWVPQYLVGGLYSEKVICGDGPECTDHSPTVISIEAGTHVDNIDICDWGFTAVNLPLPPGSTLLEVDSQMMPIE